MSNFNPNMFLKPKKIVEKQMLPLRDVRLLPVMITDMQPVNAYKATLQLKPKPNYQLPITKTLLELRPRRNDSAEKSSSQLSLYKHSRAGSPHSNSSGYVTEEYCISYDGISGWGNASTGLKDYCESCFTHCIRLSKVQNEPMPRCSDKGPWRTHTMTDSNGLVTCPMLAARMCGVCGATGISAHEANQCPWLTAQSIHLG